jgi:hypothetical protein
LRGVLRTKADAVGCHLSRKWRSSFGCTTWYVQLAEQVGLFLALLGFPIALLRR